MSRAISHRTSGKTFCELLRVMLRVSPMSALRRLLRVLPTKLRRFALSIFRLRVNRLSIVRLAARRQGHYEKRLKQRTRRFSFLLDDARFTKDRWRLGIHAGSVTGRGLTKEWLQHRQWPVWINALCSALLSSNSDRFSGRKLFDFGNSRSPRRERRLCRCHLACGWRRSSGRCGHRDYGWCALRRTQGVCNWCGHRPLPASARFSTIQDNTTVFGHSRPAGLDAMLLQQFGNGGIGRILSAQFGDGLMDWFQAGKRHAMRIRPELLNCLAQRFKIERWWCGWCVHTL